MKAVRVREYGSWDVLRVEEIPVPAPGPDQVLLKIDACGINPLDAWFRSGHLAARFARPLPYTPGLDVVGTVVSCAHEVKSLAPGDPVMGVLPILSDGGYAEYAVADADRLIPLPAGIDPVQAAAAMTPGMTGVQMVDKAFSLGACRRILVLGALGAAGRSAVASALARNLEVTAVVRPGREEEARAIGVSHVETGADPARIAALDGRFDRILDTIGPDAVAPWENALAPGGVAISVVPLPPALFSRQDAGAINFAFQPDADSLAALADLLASGGFTLPNIEIVELEDIQSAHKVLLGGARGSKFVVLPNGRSQPSLSNS